MGLAFRLEPWWPLGDDRWSAFALVCLLFVILTYFLPEELKWATRIQDSSSWKMFRFKMAVFLRAKGSDEWTQAEDDLGWEEEALDDPKIEEQHEDHLTVAEGAQPAAKGAR